MRVVVNKSKISGGMRIPGSKSHTLRAVLISGLADGVSMIDNPLHSKDTYSAIHSATAFGAKCDISNEDGIWRIKGTSGHPQVPDNVVDCGNSGGTTYFTTAIASVVDGCSVITGDEQIVKRPIRKLLNAINELGGHAYTTRTNVDAAPVVVHGRIKGGICHLDGLLSSYITGLLIATPLIDNDTDIMIEDPKEVPYLRMTLQWLGKQGIKHEVSDDLRHIHIFGKQVYRPVKCAIPGDWSSAAFPIIAAVLTGCEYTLECLDFNDVQGDKEIVNILKRMSADIEVDYDDQIIRIHPSGRLCGDLEINMEDIPDALPALAMAAATATGKVVFKGIENVRLKETDRVFVMQKVLTQMGVKVESDEKTMTVYGTDSIKGAVVDSFGDHRIAMALIAGGLVADGPVTVLNSQSVNISFPGFIDLLVKSGADITCIDD